MNKSYVMLPRLPYEFKWDESSRPAKERLVVESAVEDAALKANLFLCNDLKPEAGWESKMHSRDGKYWPCGPMTRGARPVWIWAAR